jgi:hypothetical protein
MMSQPSQPNPATLRRRFGLVLATFGIGAVGVGVIAGDAVASFASAAMMGAGIAIAIAFADWNPYYAAHSPGRASAGC